jgi:hypothetical protein
MTVVLKIIVIIISTSQIRFTAVIMILFSGCFHPEKCIFFLTDGERLKVEEMTDG